MLSSLDHLTFLDVIVLYIGIVPVIGLAASTPWVYRLIVGKDE